MEGCNDRFIYGEEQTPHIPLPSHLARYDPGWSGAELRQIGASTEGPLTLSPEDYAANLGIEAKGYRLSQARSRWGSCGKDGVVRVHWRLIQAPKAAMEYVVAHELVHLLCRNHSPEFWGKLAGTMPDWAEARELLERWEGAHRAERQGVSSERVPVRRKLD